MSFATPIGIDALGTKRGESLALNLFFSSVAPSRTCLSIAMLLGMMLLTQTFNLPISLACVLEILRRPPGQSYPCLIIVCTPYASGTDDVKHIDV
ncbi:hypothetical protein E4U10_007805 [Claviceps purpurea]|nr:hypothetical protein E4U27_008218 [Claviceps purpurea]KAG6179674.1 hypothetical protein E4U10_007805 [Claviceps purpurea]